jgi:hypothetical protein
VHTHVFARLARSVARANGMPTTRQAFVPQPVVGRSDAELRAYIDGEDAVNGGPFMQRVIAGLTNPLDDEDLAGLSFDRSAPALLEPDTEENLQRLFVAERWTDFLPVVLPTGERMEAMLAGTSHARDEVVGRMRPTAFREFWEFTVEKVAVNAVMAGARPEYLPVILAAMASGMTARQSSTTSFATIAMVNGPIRNEIDMNSGIGAFGPYNHANATIGRAYGLASQNLQGGSVPGETYMGSQGNSHGYSAAFAENEERSPWTPFHVQHGFEATDSTVSLFLGGWYTQFGTSATTPGRSASAGRCGRAIRSSGRSSRSIRSPPTSSWTSASTRARSSSTGSRRTRCCPRASTGTTNGCRRLCVRGPWWARSPTRRI